MRPLRGDGGAEPRPKAERSVSESGAERGRRPAAFVLAAVEALAGADGRSGVPAGLIYGGATT
jgi:hypothetical protein